MAGRRFHLSSGALFGLLLSVGVILLVLPRGITQKLNFLFAETFQPLIQIGRQFQLKNAAMPAPDEDYVSRQEHNKLWKEYKNLHAQLLSLQSNYETLARIRSGLPGFHSGLTLAEVNGQGSGLNHELWINKGEDDGLQRDSYVMSAEQNSIVGIIRETSGQMARVRLLTDSNQSIEVRIRRDGTDLDVGAMMFGNGKNACTIGMVEREKDVRVGDAVYAAAHPGHLDIPIIIGQVSEVKPDEGSPLLLKIVVQPAEKASSLKTVAVIVPDGIDTLKR